SSRGQISDATGNRSPSSDRRWESKPRYRRAAFDIRRNCEGAHQAYYGKAGGKRSHSGGYHRHTAGDYISVKTHLPLRPGYHDRVRKRCRALVISSGSKATILLPSMRWNNVKALAKENHCRELFLHFQVAGRGSACYYCALH